MCDKSWNYAPAVGACEVSHEILIAVSVYPDCCAKVEKVGFRFRLGLGLGLVLGIGLGFSVHLGLGLGLGLSFGLGPVPNLIQKLCFMPIL